MRELQKRMFYSLDIEKDGKWQAKNGVKKKRELLLTTVSSSLKSTLKPIL